MTRTPRSTSSIALVALVVLVVLVGGGAATAAWTRAGSGAGATASDALRAPAVTATRSSTSPTSAIQVSWSAANQLAGATYAVTRTAGGSTTTVAGCTASPCNDAGLASGTDYTYTVTAKLAGWTRSGSASASTQAVSTLTSFTLSTSTAQAGVSQNVTVTAKDQNGATMTGYTGTKTLTWSGTAAETSVTGATAVFGSASFNNGVATVSVNLKKAGTGLSLAATDGTVSGSTSLSVTANSPARLGFTTVSSNGVTQTGCLLGCTLPNRGGNGSFTTKVSVLDTYGNLATATTQINVAITRSNTGGTLSSTTLVIAGGSTESGTVTTLAESGNWNSTTLNANAPSFTGVSATISK